MALDWGFQYEPSLGLEQFVRSAGRGTKPVNLITFGGRSAAALTALAVVTAGSAGAARQPARAAARAPTTAQPAVARSAELPELAGLGPMAIGTARNDVVVGARTIGVRLWYPARSSPGAKREVYRHTARSASAPPYPITEHGSALTKAAALGGSYPLIVMSHGFGGWDTHMSQLAEALASHGYVIAAIDHRDAPFADVPGFHVSFGAVLVNRADDQRAVLRQMVAGRLGAADVVAETDRATIGLIGYSMGGYGALTTAGAELDPQAPALAQLPEQARHQAMRRDDELAGRIKAVVALAPWGAQPSARAWSDEGLRGLTAPLLLIDGNLDDVADYAEGVQRIFAKAERADRYLLTFRSAGHNIAGNPVARRGDEAFSTIEYFNDPVWRQERIVAIDQHFMLAFFDAMLKHDAPKLRYLAVPTRQSDDGQWTSAFRQQWGGTVAGDAQPGYWRGFQRRWARGLELDHKPAGN